MRPALVLVLLTMILILGCAVTTSLPPTSPADEQADTDNAREHESIDPLPPTY